MPPKSSVGKGLTHLDIALRSPESSPQIFPEIFYQLKKNFFQKVMSDNRGRGDQSKQMLPCMYTLMSPYHVLSKHLINTKSVSKPWGIL